MLRIKDGTYDTNLIDLGETIGFAGFASLVDNLILQVVRKSKHAEYVELALGQLPRRATLTFESLQRDLAALQTVDNPTTPS